MSNLLSPLQFDGLLITLVLLVMWLVIRSFLKTREHDHLLQLDTRIEALQRHLDSLEQLLLRHQSDQTQTASMTRERLIQRFDQMDHKVSERLAEGKNRQVKLFSLLREQLSGKLSEHKNSFEQRHSKVSKDLSKELWSGMQSVQEQLSLMLNQNTTDLGKRFERLTERTDQRLVAISDQVEKRLAEGFEKTTATFSDVVKRLALIDEAQKKITELSSNVVSLQEVLADKRSRGAFGEVQLNALIRNVLPEESFSFQYTFSTGNRVDCLLLMPEPTGKVAIDAKFPLESYRNMMDVDRSEGDRKTAEKQFKADIRKHIVDISEKYIIKDETSDGAMMFIPAEAVFAEIQAHQAELVEFAQQKRVWMVSPTTLWAVLNTARAVLKDAATREQIDLIQEHLGYLGKDFERFRKRMDGLARHIEQANEDVRQVHTSARKISDRFEQIERVELEDENEKRIAVENNKDIS